MAVVASAFMAVCLAVAAQAQDDLNRVLFTNCSVFDGVADSLAENGSAAG